MDRSAARFWAWARRTLAAGVISVSVVDVAVAQHNPPPDPAGIQSAGFLNRFHHQPQAVSPYWPCLPAPVPGQPIPGMGQTPGTPGQPGQPGQPGGEQGTPPAADFGAAGASQMASAPSSSAPNMFGDIFGGGRASIVVLRPSLPGVVVQPDPFPFTVGPAPGVVQPLRPLVGPGGFVTFAYAGQTITDPRFSGSLPAGTVRSLAPVPLGQPAPQIALGENPAFTAAVAQGFQSANGPGTTTFVRNTAQVSQDNSPPGFDPTDTYLVSFLYRFQGNPIPQPTIIIDIPNPSSGGVVGRNKLSEDNNPMPRDRVIFNYDFFSNTRLTAGGWDVNRFALGFEKTFFDMMASVEVKLPFAATLDSTSTSGAESTNMELGNLFFILKALLYGGEAWNVAAGMAISVPTADDTRVLLPNGVDLARIENRAYILSPYVAALYTPDDRFFTQAWMLCDFDASGSPVRADTSLAGNLQSVGRVQDQTFLQMDIQAGYWLMRSGDTRGWLRGMAPFVELHYGTTLNDADIISSGSLVVGNVSGRRDELNLAAGVVCQVGDNANVTLGAVFPLRQGDDRGFDYQLGLRASVFFGPTARSRSRATSASSY